MLYEIRCYASRLTRPLQPEGEVNQDTHRHPEDPELKAQDYYNIFYARLKASGQFISPVS